MTEQFVTYEIAKKLKKIGFDEPCLYAWKKTPSHLISSEGEFCLRTNGNPFGNFDKGTDFNTKYNLTSAPLWQQAIAWLMNSKDIFIEIVPDNYTETELAWYIYVYEKSNLLDTTSEVKCLFEYEGGDYKTYEEAREVAILKTIELWKNKK